jgi:hypothetical protein
MGGGGGLLGGVTGMLFGEPETPAVPNYTGAAEATAKGNLDAARAAAAANRVNQVTPYGSLNYAVTGADPYGNPTWTSTTTLSPDQQALYNYDIATSKGLGALQQKGLGYVDQMLASPFDTSKLAQTGINPGEQMSESIMRRLQPNIQMEQKQFDTQMANQGIPLGSEAYENAKRMFDQRQNDKLVSSIIQGTQTGLQARGQGFSEQAYQRNEPINTLNAVRSGSQVTNPNSFYVNAPQQATTAGADYLGAAGMTGNAAIADANAKNAQQNAMMQGLFSLGGAAMMSDIRTKENIKHIGSMANGLPVYEFEYKPEFKAIAGEGKFIGVMAQEVELVQPEAVITRPDGYKMVNYGALQ